MAEQKSLSKVAGSISVATMASRVLGFARDAINASLFGASAVSDAYFAAYRIPNLLRDLLAEGALSAAFVPAFTRAREKRGDGEAWLLAALVLNALLMVLGAVVVLGELFAPALVAGLASGFAKRPDQFALTVTLTRWLFPFIGFMAVGALFMGMHNARRSFFLPALAPALMNLVMVAGGWWLARAFGDQPQKQILGWALAALLGGAVQCFVQLPPLLKSGFRFRLKWPFANPEVVKVAALMVPAAFALSVTQINQVVNTNFSSHLPEGTISWLYYGQRLMQLPLGVFGVSIATAALPSLASHHTRGDMAQFRSTLIQALRLSLLVCLPATAGLIALSTPINTLLFQWGRFTPRDAQAVALASSAYSLGIVAAGWVKVLTPVFYVLDDSRTPVLAALALVLLNAALNLLAVTVLPLEWRYLGLALTSGAVACVNAAALLWLLRRRLGPLGLGPLLRDLARLAAAALAMGLLVAAADRGLDIALGKAASRPALAARVAGLIALGAAAWWGLARMLGFDMLASLRRKPKSVGMGGPGEA